MDSTSVKNSGLSPPLDMSHHYSRATARRHENEFKSIYKYFAIPGMGNLAGGLPNENLFPFDTLEAQVARPERWTPTPNGPHHDQLSTTPAKPSSLTTASSHITVPKSASGVDLMKRIDVATALQYGTAEGYPALRSFVRQFTRENLHPTVPYEGGPEILLTCGSTDGFSKIAELIIEPWFEETSSLRERPSMLTEAFIYSGPLGCVLPKGVQVVPVEYDGIGMIVEGPGGLDDILDNWDFSQGRRPHFMYTVTMGHNPMGGLLPVERRRQIYAVCSRYDIMIVEDDPYWYLQYPSTAAAEAKSRNQPEPRPMEAYKPSKSSGYEFIDSLVPSFLSIDTEGRVLRLDTFSKTVAPGCRLGWVTAQPAMIERLQRITEATTQAPSGFVQAMVAETVIGPQPEATATFRALSLRDKRSYKGWNMDGWVRWLAGLRGVYERRMTRMCTILDEHSSLVKQVSPVDRAEADWDVVNKTKILSFDWPRGGMFVWIRLIFESHPLWQAKGETIPVFDGPVLAAGLLGFLAREPHMVLPGPGSFFAATPEILKERSWAYVRLCFAAVSEEDVDACSLRFGKGVQEFWRIESVEEMEQYAGGLSSMMSELEPSEGIAFPMGC